MKTFGLDIGTTSIGWAIVEEGVEIQKAGVHIFPVGVRDDKYAKSGTEESKNVGRRNARMARRLLFRYKLRRAQLLRILLQNGMMPDTTTIGDCSFYLPLLAKDLFSLRAKALDGPISLNELGRILLHLNQRRGFKSGRKGKKSGEDETGILKTMGELDAKIEASGARTLGEYFYKLYEAVEHKPDWHNPDEPLELIRNRAHKAQSRYVYRSTYEKEFDAIWAEQKKHHSILTDELKIAIKDRTIFYQRPLKSAKHLVARCPFYAKKRVMPKSHPLYQEFRIWQMLSNLRITVPSNRGSAYRAEAKLTLEEKHALAKLYQYEEQVGKKKRADCLKAFGIGSEASFNVIEGMDKGNSTLGQFVDALGKERVLRMPVEEVEQLWHVIYCANEDGDLHEKLVKFYHFNTDEADELVAINLVLDYGSLSRKAVTGILAHMKEGMDYAEACLACGFHHSHDAEAVDPNRILEDKLVRTKDDDLRNPLVTKVVSETYRLVNALISAYGRPDLIKVEFARSLQKPKAAREKELNQNREKQARREAYANFLKNHPAAMHIRMSSSLIAKFELFLELEHSLEDLKRLDPEVDVDAFSKFASRVNPKDQVKYHLWMECGRISPYTGKVIRLSDLFSPEIEIEHILPYSISQDNSFINLTLAERSFNEAKGNRTPIDYFKTRPEAELIAFKKRAAIFGEGKRKRLLFDGTDEEIENKFRPDALAATAYISRVVRKKFLKVVKEVQTTNGQTTKVLRDKWGLNHLLEPEEGKKNRNDHRHHAVDALVIACTTRSQIQKLSREATFDHRGKLRIENFPAPMERFYHQAEVAISEVLVSYRKENQLISTRSNVYRKGKEVLNRQSGLMNVRGPLHEETLYGQITHPQEKKKVFVVRKKLAALKVKQLSDVVDKAVREWLTQLTQGYKPDELLGKIFPDGIYMNSQKEGIKVPIYKVRLRVNSNSMIQLRPNENPNLFAESGSNYGTAFYQDANGKFEESTVNFFEAVSRKRNGIPVFPAQLDGKQLYCVLQINDLVLIDLSRDDARMASPALLSKHLYRVQKISKGDYNFRHHLAARIDNDSTLIRIRSAKDIRRILPIKLDPSGRVKI